MNIVIINTNCANLLSVKNAVRQLKYNPIISDDPNVIYKADKLFLPGVGTAIAAMQELKKKIN